MRRLPVGRSAVVHDFFVAEGGGERAAIEFTRLLPQADVYTTFFDERKYRDRIDPARVHTWPLQRLLGPTPRFRQLLPLYPLWYSALDLRAYDLVVTSSIAFTNAVRTRPDATHVTYVHTPMRYAWDLDTYLSGSSYGAGARIAARTVRPLLRRWLRRSRLRSRPRPRKIPPITATSRNCGQTVSKPAPR